MKKKTRQEWIDKCHEVHSYKYDYSNFTEEVRASSKQVIICPTHGEFSQLIQNHSKGADCIKCYRERSKEFTPYNKKSTKDWIKQSTEAHKGKYDYSKLETQNSISKGIIICPTHGEFTQVIGNHARGAECPKCNKERLGGIFRKSYEDWIKDFNAVHGDKYKYPRFNINNGKEKITIVCDKHGEFQQKPNGHASGGKGCPKCTIEEQSKKKTKTYDKWISDFQGVHKGRYEYPVEPFKAKDYIDIKCKKHGIFKQTACMHYYGQGCPKCVNKVSKPEIELQDWIKTIYGGEVLCNKRGVIGKKELDIFLPEKKLAIEYNGIYYHSSKFIENDSHSEKHRLCNNKGIELFQVYEDEWDFKKPIVKSMILNKAGLTKRKLNGRSCTIREVSTKEAYDFTEENHIQGYTSATYYIGLYYKKELVSLISFKKDKNKGVYNLNRFCTKLNTIVRGGFSKLLKHFINNYDVDVIETFSDNSYSDGGLYNKNGFEVVKTLKPDYKYLVGRERKHKFGFRKKKLKKMFPHSKGTEKQITEDNKIYRVYDAGKVKYSIKTRNKNQQKNEQQK